MASLTEALRRIYHEMVERRSRVRVVEAAAASEQDLEATPAVFLVGPYRSGTTLLRYAIDSHSRLCCPPESDFIAPLSLLLTDMKSREGLHNMGFEEDLVVAKLRGLICSVFSTYAASWEKTRWVDKTPQYVDYLDILLRLFPRARFILIFRHGLDQAHSFTRGGTFPRPELEGYGEEGEDLRLGASRYWREKTEKVLEFQNRHPDLCHALRYEDLCRRPEEELRQICSFLDEPWEPAMLKFYDQPHDKGNEDGRVVGTRGFQVSKEHYLGWPEELLAQGLEIVGPTLEGLGYSRAAVSSSPPTKREVGS